MHEKDFYWDTGNFLVQFAMHENLHTITHRGIFGMAYLIIHVLLLVRSVMVFVR